MILQGAGRAWRSALGVVSRIPMLLAEILRLTLGKGCFYCSKTKVTPNTFCSLALTLALAFVVFATPATDARAEVNCIGVPHDQGGTASEFWYFDLDTLTCRGNSNGGSAPANGFQTSTDDDDSYIRAAYGTVGPGGVGFASCTTTSDNLTSMVSLAYNVGGQCATGGGAQYTGAVNQTYNFKMVLVGATDGISYTLIYTVTATDGTNHVVSAMSVSGGAFGAAIAVTTSTTAQDKSNIVAALQSSLNSVTPGLLNGVLPLNGNSAGGGNGVTFAPTGLGFSRSSINSANPMDRRYGFAFADKGYFAHRDTRRRNNGFNFSVDLNQMARSANEADASALGYGVNGSKDGPTQPRSRFSSWVTGTYVDFDDDETNADRDGHLWAVTSGLGMRMGTSTTIGILTRYRTGDADSNALAASLETEAYGGGAYLTTKLGGGLNVALATLYELGDNDIIISGDRGNFDHEQFTIEGRIDKRFTRGSMWIEPGVGLRYIDTDQDNYTDSSGALVTNQDLTLGRMTYGPTIGTTIIRGSTEIRPFAKINGVWDFENDGNFVTSTAGTFTSGDNALNLGSGVEVQYASGFAIKLSGNWYSFDSDLEAWSVSGSFGAPLSAFGIGSAGLVSLDLSSNGEEASATARVRIPLN